MTGSIDMLLQSEPREWIGALAPYQRDLVEQLLAQGQDYESAVNSWLTASAENTFRFGGENRPGDKSLFRDKLVLEIEAFFCGDPKYEKERDGLLGEKSAARVYVISALSVAIAPALGVTAAFLAPIVALTLASFGKITVNAWCQMRKAERKEGAPPV